MTRLNEVFNLAFTQAEVDFVIPDLSVDLPLSIDPFLLFKSRDSSLRNLHDQLLSVFNEAISQFREGNINELNRLIDFPEVNEIGFGYSDQRIQGSGLGDVLNRLLVETLKASPELQKRRLRHVEELQLVSIGVGPDRVSDIAANALKGILVDYTQQQANLWNIPLTKDVPLHHIFDFDDRTWYDDYADLPRNPVSGLPILLVPRRVVRLLPWINYDDYARTDFRAFLRPSKGPRVPRRPGDSKERIRNPAKQQIIEVTRNKIELLDQYVSRKERGASEAEPALGNDQFSTQAEFNRGQDYISRLQALQVGHDTASDYQRLVFEMLNFLFEPELTDGQMEEKTYRGTERRDIVYANEAERSFLKYIRDTYGSIFLLFESKNVKQAELEHVNQVAAYLGVRLGMLGFIVTRQPPGENIILKTYSVYNDTPSVPRKTILFITDDDLIAMIRMKLEGGSPVAWLQRIYRGFRMKVQ